MRKRPRVDENQRDIVDALERVGCLVLSLAALGNGAPDLLVWHRRCGFVLMELKNADGALTLPQREFHAYWPVELVRSVDEALAAVGVRVGATSRTRRV